MVSWYRKNKNISQTTNLELSLFQKRAMLGLKAFPNKLPSQ